MVKLARQLHFAQPAIVEGDFQVAQFVTTIHSVGGEEDKRK